MAENMKTSIELVLNNFIKLSEQYLIELCVFSFNIKNHFDYNPNDFSLAVIDKNQNSDFAVEVYTTSREDDIILRTYFSINKWTEVNKYKLADSIKKGEYECKIFLADAIINMSFIYLQTYEKQPEFNHIFVLLKEDRGPLLLEKNSYLLLE